MCLWDGDSCDNPEVSTQKDRVARKEHKCNECGRTIRVGETYTYVFQVYYRDPYQSCTCAHCRVAQRWLKRECGGYLFEALWEDVKEHINEYPTFLFPLGRLVVAHRRKWETFAGTGLMPVPAVPDVSIEEYVSA